MTIHWTREGFTHDATSLETERKARATPATEAMFCVWLGNAARVVCGIRSATAAARSLGWQGAAWDSEEELRFRGNSGRVVCVERMMPYWLRYAPGTPVRVLSAAANRHTGTVEELHGRLVTVRLTDGRLVTRDYSQVMRVFEDEAGG